MKNMVKENIWIINTINKKQMPFIKYKIENNIINYIKNKIINIKLLFIIVILFKYL
jgi:dephospho-CoA kinase